ncbi:hypothetical protein [Streptosporangium longisporum]|uniref:PH domain-containing protein n=1 Tax=Streptosporangium longisporum TaxID=46187 RepID=A0ABP6KH82_9ACTN
MSLKEKSAWLQAISATCMYAAYLVVVLGPARSASVTGTAYQRPMITIIVAGIVVSIVAQIVMGMTSPGAAGRTDERDIGIHRHGEYVGYYVVSAGAAAALALAMAEADPFWIANVIFLAFVLAAVVTSVVKIVAYRRGF